MKIKNKLSILGFHLANLLSIVFYLYPGSIIGHILYEDRNIQPQITRDFIVSSNHFFVFFILSILGIFAYRDEKKIKFIIVYLFLLSRIWELFHIIIPEREFEWYDLFGNMLGVILVIIIYKVMNRYV